MMPSNPNRSAARLVRILAAVLAFSAVVPVLAEEKAAEAAGGAAAPARDEVNVEVSVAALLGNRGLFDGSLSDPVWTVTPRAGRRLIQLPVLPPKPGEMSAPVELSGDVLKVGRARFVGWRIESSRDQNAGVALNLKPVPADAPRIARRLTLTPDGTVRWSLERSIPGAEAANSSNPYSLRLNRKLLQAQRPKRPPTIKRQPGADRKEHRRQVRDASAQYKKLAAEYNKLRRGIKSLETKFEDAMPPLLLAVYDVSENMRALSIAKAPPRPWSIQIEQLEVLRTAGQAFGGQQGAGYSAQAQEMLRDVGRMVDRDAHPYTLRAVAYALESAPIERMRQRDELFAVFSAIIASSDSEARMIVVSTLARHGAPSNAVQRLMMAAANDENPTIKLMALRGFFSSGQRRAQELDGLVQQVRDLLNSMDTPEDVLEQLLLEGSDQFVANALISGLSFDGLSGPGLDRAIVFVIRRAGTDAIATGWLDRQLLGSNPIIRSRTLEVLDASRSGTSFVEPLVTGLFNAWLGTPDRSGAEARVPSATLSGPIPIQSSSHGLFPVLNAGDPETRQRSWHVLRHFYFATPQDAPRHINRQGNQEARPDDPYQALVAAALGRSTSALQAAAAAEFMARQDDLPRSSLGLVQLALSHQSDASARAVHLLLGSGRDLDPAVRSLSGDDRQQFAASCYRAVKKQPPLAAALLRQDVTQRNDVPVIAWFAGSVAHGHVPEPDEWAPAAGGEDRLLDLVNPNDKSLALAAVSALVTRAGGDEQQAREITDYLLGREGVSRADLLDEWRDQRRKVFLSRLTAAAGPYKLTVRIYSGDDQTTSASAQPPGSTGGARPPAGVVPPGVGGPGPFGPGRFERGARGAPVRKFEPSGKLEIVQEIGTVVLQVEETTISFGTQAYKLSVPDEQLAVRFDEASDLQPQLKGEATDLKVDQVESTIDLLPEANGVWRGGVELPDGWQLELIMQPIRQSGGK
ncbi:MAG: hypothetical protein CMJ18_21040 [Phycisphaeraceae bacterium]|nr:hypothetical protein [Phycisphaeraceae bacterium]